MPGLEAETGSRVEWRPVDGREIRRLRGRDPFAGEPASGQYDWRYRETDARRWAAHYGIPFREPGHELDFRLLIRAATAAARLGAAAAYGWRICAAVYGSEVWPLDQALCAWLARDVGLVAERFGAMLADPETERLLTATAEEAHRRGAFGVPTFFVGDEMFWGNDRIVLLRDRLLRRF
jgi:2-hydroxychromene-2-carboxylate isomerase